MGLLNKNDKGSGGEMVTDCVGKTGFCEYVTDPRTGKLFKNGTVFQENQNSDSTQTNNVEFSRPSNQELNESSALDDQTIAKALVDIISKLNLIVEMLKVKNGS